MTWRPGALHQLLGQDVDDVVEEASSLTGKDRTVALRASLSLLQTRSEELERLKVLLFIQSLLATMTDGELVSSVAEPVATELARVVSGSDPDELKIPALDGLALVFLKAKELTSTTDVLVRAAFHIATVADSPRLSEFAERAFLDNGILAQRVVQDSIGT